MPDASGLTPSIVPTKYSCCESNDWNQNCLVLTNLSEEAESLQTNVLQKQVLLYRNFLIFAIAFGANHAAGLVCIVLASSQLGVVSSGWQTGTLYATYTVTAFLPAVPVTQTLGSKRTIVLGMALFSVYVVVFYFIVLYLQHDHTSRSEWGMTLGSSSNSSRDTIGPVIGAAIGGIGAGMAWTAQGVYFGQTAERMKEDHTIASSRLAAIFACAVLSLETLFDVLATVLVQWFLVSWSTVFGLYSIIAVASTLVLQLYVVEYKDSIKKDEDNDSRVESKQGLSWTNTPDHNSNDQTFWYKTMTAGRVLRTDPKMKYMVGFNTAFALAGAFLNSFVNGEVVQSVTGDASWVGVLTAVHGLVAALCSLCFGRVPEHKIWVLVIGSLAFAGTALPFVVCPSYSDWSWPLLVLVYVAEGIGRASFEGTLKATFAEYFVTEKEGAFANIVLQYGLSSTAAYFLSTRMGCRVAVLDSSAYCVEYHDGTIHNVLTFSSLVLGASALSVVGLLRAAYIYSIEKESLAQRQRHFPTSLPGQAESFLFVARNNILQNLEVEMIESIDEVSSLHSL